MLRPDRGGADRCTRGTLFTDCYSFLCRYLPCCLRCLLGCLRCGFLLILPIALLHSPHDHFPARHIRQNRCVFHLATVFLRRRDLLKRLAKLLGLCTRNIGVCCHVLDSVGPDNQPANVAAGGLFEKGQRLVGVLMNPALSTDIWGFIMGNAEG